MTSNVHLIAASRDRFLSGGAVVRLGRKLHQLSADDLRLNHTELSVYARRCGTDLSERQIDALLHSSEGWFSAVYLNLCAFAKTGELPDNRSDIYQMFSAAMMDPLPESLLGISGGDGVADEFTAEMAEFCHGKSGYLQDPCGTHRPECVCEPPAGRSELSFPSYDEGMCGAGFFRIWERKAGFIPEPVWCLV